MTKILNCTLHQATADQIKDGVFEPVKKSEFLELLEIKKLPTNRKLTHLAHKIVDLALEELGLESLYKDECTGYDWKYGPRGYVMIGGAAYLMPKLASSFRNEGILPIYSFTERVSEEVTQPDGSVKKTQLFKHIGFVGLE